MAIVKHPHEASAVTLESKHQRYDRLRRLFGIRRLGDLFPPGSTPNGAAHDPAYCSGDVLRDLCQIGEYLKNKGVGRTERCERVRKEFRAGEIVQHREIRELLSRVKKNEFEERLKNMMKKEPGLDEEEEDTKINMHITTTNNRHRDDPFFDREGTSAVAITDKQTCVSAFMPNAQAAIQRMQTSEEVEEVKYADTPGFATAEQIRASFMSRKRSNLSPIKRKRDNDVVMIKEEPVSASSTQEHEFDEAINTSPKRNRFSKNPLTPHSARRIAQNNNTAPAKLAGRRTMECEKTMMMRDEGDSDKKLKEVTDLVHHLDIMIGNAQKKLRDDVGGAETLLVAAKKLIREGLGRTVTVEKEEGGRSFWEEEEADSVLREPTGPVFRDSVGLTLGKPVGRVSREEAMYRDSSEDGV
ncbi:hypothetical protein EG328_006471 [Venturia inaequalis]|uniref:Uncharacterized protein n=1 Tax=Venturia inaequalis TaxID=5025 RepID=A0A8H3UNQ3_VENIN|nr:hypothetical protein EG328_006471 [Venturia inaequalis]KAE9973020.1 hypothetical protein EG327_009287 [Venturia inaequalis]